MLKLIRKELIFNRNNLLIILAIMTAFLMFIYYYQVKNFSPRALLLFSAFYIGATLCITLEAREDRFKMAPLTCSLPYNRKTIVAARFALTWLLMLAGLIYSLALSAVLPFCKANLGQALNLKTILISLLLLTLIFALMLPLTIRFGIMGVILFLVFTQLLGVVSLLVGMFLKSGRASFFLPLKAAFRGLRYLTGPQSTTADFILVGAAIILLNAASLVISQALYARRDL
jgi:hypothetical protein